MGEYSRKDGAAGAGKAANKPAGPGPGILSQIAAWVLLAIRDHWNHLDTPGARLFGRVLAYTRTLLLYGAYMALIYLRFSILLDVQASLEQRDGLSQPEMPEARVALFYILFFSLTAPVIAAALYIAVGTAGNYAADVAWRRLPRLAAPLFYPAALIVLAFNMNTHQPAIVQQLAGGYVYAESVVASARGHQPVVASANPEAGQQAQRDILQMLRQRDAALRDATGPETATTTESDTQVADEEQDLTAAAKAYRSVLEELGMLNPVEKKHQ